MTDESSEPLTEPVDAAGSRSVLALVIAAMLVVAVVIAVMLFGVARPPALGLIADAGPSPGASVTWTAWEDGQMCVYVASPDGEVRTAHCERDGGEVIGWTDEGLILQTWTSTGSSEVVVDPATGDVLDRRALSDDRGRTFPEGVRAYREGGRLIVEREQSRTVVWEVDAPDAYEIFLGVHSPDGEWVALTDSARRLLVVRADGSAPPRVWVEPFEGWHTVVWEGTDPFDDAQE